MATRSIWPAASTERRDMSNRIGIERIAIAINQPGGADAVSLRIAEQYVKEFGKLAKENNTLILPAELSNIGSVVASLSKTLAATQDKG